MKTKTKIHKHTQHCDKSQEECFTLRSWRHCDGAVTVLILQIADEYYGMLMNKKIDAVWLTIERIAELKGCSNRTVWRYIDKHKMHTVKR